MLEQKRLDRISRILDEYKGEMPLSRFLTNYYKAHPEMGSTDRRMTSRVLYAYFRMGKILPGIRREEKIAVALYLTENTVNPLTDYSIRSCSNLDAGELGTTIDKKLEKIKIHYPSFSLDDLFPFSSPLSEGIDREKFLKSFLTQPRLWIRVVRKFRNEVIAELEKKNISYKISSQVPDAMSFENGTALNKLESFEKGFFEIQDLSSQKCGSYFRAAEQEHWWDCCAGSGGKSLLLHSLTPSVRLTVTDNRAAILENLKERFTKAGINKYTLSEIDLTLNFKPETSNLFHGILADVPCTGSGTWGRTPEAISFFSEKSINTYTEKQKKIVEAVVPSLKKGSPLLYITCSVFKKENEEMVNYFAEHLRLSIESINVIKGYDFQSDMMFISRMIKV